MFWIIISIIISIGMYLIFNHWGFDSFSARISSVVCSVILGALISLIIYAIIFYITWGINGSKIDVIYETSSPNVIVVEEILDIDDGFFKEYIIGDTVIDRYLQVKTEDGNTVGYTAEDLEEIIYQADE